ncbi:hypothetical protein QQ045_007394 [Rhodiola kirilowii]
MDCFLFEESGDSETKDYFDPNRNNKAAVSVVDADQDAESCCSDSSDHRDAARAYRRSDGISRRMKTNNRRIAQSTYHHDGDECYINDEEEADSSSKKVLNNVVINDHVATKKKKLENSVSESFIISSSGVGVGVVVNNNNMDEITDDRLFWEACLANGYP